MAAGEECDVGGESALCDSDCTLPVCGDGHLNRANNEQCDDGNRIDDDACSNQCTVNP
jgi:cysteine-rich repeat protein